MKELHFFATILILIATTTSLIRSIIKDVKNKKKIDVLHITGYYLEEFLQSGDEIEFKSNLINTGNTTVYLEFMILITRGMILHESINTKLEAGNSIEITFKIPKKEEDRIANEAFLQVFSKTGNTWKKNIEFKDDELPLIARTKK